MNSLQEAYLKIYQAQLNEGMSEDEKEMRRLAAQERRAGKSDRMSAKVASKYADSEARSAGREDKKSRGKHIAGMADSVEVDGDLVDEAVYGGKKEEPKDTRMVVTHADKRGNTKAYQNYKAGDKRYKAGVGVDESAVPGKPAERLVTDRAGYRVSEKEAEAARERIKAKMAARKTKKEEVEVDEAFPNVKGTLNPWEDSKTGKSRVKMVSDPKTGKPKEIAKEEIELDERALDSTEKKEKERIVKGMKKSAKDFKSRYGDRAKSVMYATATKRAKERMDTSKSDLRYGVER